MPVSIASLALVLGRSASELVLLLTVPASPTSHLIVTQVHASVLVGLIVCLFSATSCCTAAVFLNMICRRATVGRVLLLLLAKAGRPSSATGLHVDPAPDYGVTYLFHDCKLNCGRCDVKRR